MYFLMFSNQGQTPKITFLYYIHDVKIENITLVVYKITVNFIAALYCGYVENSVRKEQFHIIHNILQNFTIYSMTLKFKTKNYAHIQIKVPLVVLFSHG